MSEVTENTWKQELDEDYGLDTMELVVSIHPDHTVALTIQSDETDELADIQLTESQARELRDLLVNRIPD